MHTINTLGSNQEVTFLTEKGLYQVIFASRKPMAKQFKNWVCEVILDIAKIRNTIQDFDNTEKVAHTMGTLGGNQDGFHWSIKNV